MAVILIVYYAIAICLEYILRELSVTNERRVSTTKRNEYCSVAISTILLYWALSAQYLPFYQLCSAVFISSFGISTSRVYIILVVIKREFSLVCSLLEPCKIGSRGYNALAHDRVSCFLGEVNPFFLRANTEVRLSYLKINRKNECQHLNTIIHANCRFEIQTRSEKACSSRSLSWTGTYGTTRREILAGHVANDDVIGIWSN